MTSETRRSLGDPRDKVCVVTGGASGIGRALARRFAGAGMRIAIGDVERAALDATVAELGGDGARVIGVHCDVRSVDDVQKLRDETVRRFGYVHLVCLNAGVAPVGPLLETSLETWTWVLDVNLRGVIHGMHVFGPLLVAQGAGHIVCTASAAGVSDTPTVGAYGASKHAVVGLAAALRSELVASGVGVSVVCPGLIDTRIFESERNRPDAMADPSRGNPLAEQYREALATNGAPPELVADFVHRAVLDGQFFVFPTSDLDAMIEARLADVRQGLVWRDAQPSSLRVAERLLRHDDVKRLFAADELATPDRRCWEFHQPSPGGSYLRWAEDNSLFALEPDEHARLRRLFSASLTPRAVKRYERQVRETVERFAAPLRGVAGTIELMADFANPIPNAVISRIMGIPPAGDEEQHFCAIAQTALRGVFPFADEVSKRAADAAFAEIAEWVGTLVRERRVRLEEDMISDLIRVQDRDDRLTDDEIVLTVTGLLAAGSETTAIGGMVAAGTLLAHPEQADKLRREPTWIPNAVLEIMRTGFGFGGIGGPARYARRDFELRGKAIRQGQMLMLSFDGAGRDPAVYVDPDRFDVTRDVKDLITFGHGMHYCLGVHLASSRSTAAMSVRLNSWRTTQPRRSGEQLVGEEERQQQDEQRLAEQRPETLGRARNPPAQQPVERVALERQQ